MSWKRFLRRKQWNDERALELQAHLEIEADENISRGMLPDEARYAANRKLGNTLQIREEIYRMNSIGFLGTIQQDVRFALRMLQKNPAFTMIAVLILALGIGATTAIFSVVNAVLIRPLPYKDPSRLVAMSSMYRQGASIRTFPNVSLNAVEEWRKESHSLESIGSFVFSGMPVNVGQQSMFLVAIGADPELLSTLGVVPMAGKNFSGSGSTQPDNSVIISHKLWAEAFQSDPAAVGRTILVDGDLFTVTGILPSSFQFPRSDASYSPEEPDVIYPVSNIADGWGRDSSQWLAIGRLKPGVSEAQAQAELQSIIAIAAQKNPAMKGMSVRVAALDADTTRKVRSALLMMLGISIVLLLIACTNIMNLLFSRAAARGREMAVRKAVGASSWRLVRQMLTESACLTFVSGIVGVGLARIALDALVSLSPAHLPISGHVRIDVTVLGFAFLVCSVAAIIAGVFPALHRSRQTENMIHAGSRTSGGRALAYFQRALMVTQIALGVGLLAAAGLLVHSLYRLSSVDPGFRTAGVLGFELAVPSTHDATDAARQQKALRMKQLFQRMLEEIRTIPGVLSAGWITNLPPETRAGMFMPFSIVGSDPQNKKPRAFCNYQVTSEDYFQTVAVPIVKGRDFTFADANGAPRVMIVNETFARQYLGDADPIGQRIVTPFDPANAPRQIVGVIRDSHDRGLNTKSIATAYVPYEQFAQAYGSIVLRTNLPPETVFPEIRARIAKLDPTISLKDFTTVSERIYKTLDEPRFYTLMAGACALMAVLFVTLGLYGVVSYSVARRTSEIGIRMALGAPRGRILKGVLWQGLQMAAIGIPIGLALSLATTRILTTLLFEIKPNDPATLAVAALLVLIVTLAASYIPARRASRVDPMIALRYE